jgi:CheY-like chemotaxis protein
MLGRSSATGSAAPARPGRPPLRLIELSRDEVEPLGEEVPNWLFESSFEPADAASAGEAEPVPTAPGDSVEITIAPDPGAATTLPDAPPSPIALPGAPAAGIVATPAASAPRALIAEDSITACIFLERLLEQRGFAVLTVGSARDLGITLAREPWDLVLADVDLPDAPGGSGLVGLSPRRIDGARAPIVALVRDREDAALARAAGVPHVLRKPFEYADVEHVLATLGLAGPHTRS